jgi:hypothetical protein
MTKKHTHTHTHQHQKKKKKGVEEVVFVAYEDFVSSRDGPGT